MSKVANVKCSVDECVYWGSGNVCEADAIEINRNSGFSQGGITDSGFGGSDIEAGQLGEFITHSRKDSTASISQHTMCRTFKPKPTAHDR